MAPPTKLSRRPSRDRLASSKRSPPRRRGGAAVPGHRRRQLRSVASEPRNLRSTTRGNGAWCL